MSPHQGRHPYNTCITGSMKTMACRLTAPGIHRKAITTPSQHSRKWWRAMEKAWSGGHREQSHTIANRKCSESRSIRTGLPCRAANTTANQPVRLSPEPHGSYLPPCRFRIVVIILDFHSLLAASGWGQKPSPLGEDFSILIRNGLMAPKPCCS